MNRLHEFEIRHGLSQQQVADAAAILYDAFERKLSPFLRSRADAIAVIRAILNPAVVIAAVRRGMVVGLCGVRRRGQRFLRPRLRPFVRQFGPMGGPARLLAFLVLEAPVPKGELMIESLAVRPDMRGRTIGTQILRAAYAYARSGNLAALRLDVVDTNPDAQRLYERLGFRYLRKRRYPFMRRLMGFSAVTTMRWPVDSQRST